MFAIHLTPGTAAGLCRARWSATLGRSVAAASSRTNLTLNIRLMRQLLCGSEQSDAGRCTVLR